MAQFDTSIYATARPKSVAEFDAEADAADARKLTGQSNRLHLLLQQRQVRDAQRAEDDQNRLLTTLRGLPATATDEDRINALRGGAFFNQADALEKSSLDRKKTTADIGKTGAETTGKQAETLAKTAQTYRDQLPLVTSPQAAAQWLQGQFSDPVLGAHMRSMGTFEEFVKRIPQEPKAFEQWRQQAGMGMDKFVADQTARRGQDIGAETSRGNNRATVSAALANADAVREQAQATRDAAHIQTGFTNESNFRKEFEGLPEIKNYKQAYPAYAAVTDAAKRNTPQSDINIVYGIAKLYDPTSVVREGEYATVANSPAIPEKIKGYAQYLAGGGKLSEETKKQLLDEAKSRIGTYKTEADKATASYKEIATRRGIDPRNVFQAMGDAAAGGEAPPANVLPTAADIDAAIVRKQSKQGRK